MKRFFWLTIGLFLAILCKGQTISIGYASIRKNISIEDVKMEAYQNAKIAAIEQTTLNLTSFITFNNEDYHHHTYSNSNAFIRVYNVSYEVKRKQVKATITCDVFNIDAPQVLIVNNISDIYTKADKLLPNITLSQDGFIYMLWWDEQNKEAGVLYNATDRLYGGNTYTSLYENYLINIMPQFMEKQAAFDYWSLNGKLPDNYYKKYGITREINLVFVYTPTKQYINKPIKTLDDIIDWWVSLPSKEKYAPFFENFIIKI